ncbi:BatA domain-containing protein [Algoriphagus terrigena]|uniref:BatA domain-containing protein n=1 Tax=Algoriphagus terrigena TaxID=344884 RepID=UPI0004231805|nr:BatA domain-containing protein [Algoriphagus terrigena]
MEWIQPAFFLGLLGISIPLAIHLWNGRRGKVIAWAATAWLNPVESQSSRSLKLDQLLLLLVRIALFVMIVLFVVGLWWKFLGKSEASTTVHLVMPSAQVEADFRFELEQALQAGEEVFWLAEGLPDYDTGENPPIGFDSEELPLYLETLPKNLDSIHWYASGSESEIAQSILWVPKIPQVHLASKLSAPAFSSQVIQLESGKYLGLDEQGMLISVADGAGISKERISFSGVIPVFFELEDEVKKADIDAALTALTEVYGLTFSEGEKQNAQVIFSDLVAENPKSEKLYFVTEADLQTSPKNEVSLANSVAMPWDEVVDKGILPELILDPLVGFLGISAPETFLTKSQIEQRFMEIPQSKQSAVANTSEIFLVLIVLLFGLERFLAFRSNL